MRLVKNAFNQSLGYGLRREKCTQRGESEKREGKRREKKAKSLEAIKAEVEEWVGGCTEKERERVKKNIFFPKSEYASEKSTEKVRKWKTLVEYILCTHTCEVMTHDPLEGEREKVFLTS